MGFRGEISASSAPNDSPLVDIIFLRLDFLYISDMGRKFLSRANY